jgi:hypothetical protein
MLSNTGRKVKIWRLEVSKFKDVNIQSTLDVFPMPYNVDSENISPELQLKIIEIQWSTYLKQLFLNSTKLDFYRAYQKSEFPKMCTNILFRS